jgi:hypothetical protein
VLQRDPGQIDARGDVELAEHLAQVESDGVRADEQLVGYLPIGQAPGHQAGRGLLDVGEAGPASRRPSLTRPVPAPHPELAQPPAGTRHASPRPEPAVLHERLLQAANGLVVPARRGQQHALVLYRAGAGPRVRQLVGRVLQAGNVARQQPLGVFG